MDYKLYFYAVRNERRDEVEEQERLRYIKTSCLKRYFKKPHERMNCCSSEYWNSKMIFTTLIEKLDI
jgi:hypothetical protein